MAKKKVAEFQGMAIVDGLMVALTWEHETAKTVSKLNVDKVRLSKDIIRKYDAKVLEKYNKFRLKSMEAEKDAVGVLNKTLYLFK